MTYEIKGQCEECGFAYKGTIGTDVDGSSFARIKCPSCGEETYNFDTADMVEIRDKEDGHNLSYKQSTFETVS